MGTMNAFYVRAETEGLTAAIQKSFPAAELSTGNGFTSTILPNDQYEPPKDALAQLSSDFNTDVMWLGFQSVVDAFNFQHWQNGSLLRSLVYGCHEEERTWEVAEGQPEPWEEEAFFAPNHLKFLVGEIAKNEEEKSQYERIWQNRELVQGRNEPMVSSKAVAWVVARHYNFPGWGSPGKPVPPLPQPPAPAAPPPVPPAAKAFQVRARLVPRYLWTSASIDVYLNGRCILMTGGQMKLSGGYSSAFKDGGKEHLAELKWGLADQHQFPYELWIDGTKVMQSWVPVENWRLGYVPVGIIFIIMFAVSAVGTFYLLSRIGK